ncbi:MAG: HAMP domain-containing sensor histidine kinase [Planctomycetota bacterium]|nr:HAMP domain-containing sensor histidine kinase [Planctomycetota bacterium]
MIWPIWWWLVSRALGNCEAIEKTAQLIIKDNRDVRIDLGAMDSEFVPMARNVNLMLDHVNQLHDTQARFISDASHELRTPIAGILNNAEVGHDDTIEEMREALGYCRESAKRMSRLVNNLLSLTGGEVFRDKPSQTVSVESLFFEAVDRIEPIATDARIELVISHPDVALYVRGDSDQLLQVLQNLLANAIQHSKSGDVVRLESCVLSEDGKRHIVMRVIDMGPGIDPRLENRVFERFYRGRAEYDGSGLGLAICKVIIDRHGGTIAYRPNSPCGTIFEVKLDVPASLDCACGSI